MPEWQFTVTVDGPERPRIEPTSSQPAASQPTSSQASNLRQASLSFAAPSSSPAIGPGARTTVASDSSQWTLQEDKKLLRAERLGVKPVRCALARFGLNKTESSYRNRKKLLKKKYPNWNPPEDSEHYQPTGEEETAGPPVASQRQSWTPGQITVLCKTLAQGLDWREIQSVHFANRSEESVSKKLRAVRYGVIQREKLKDDFPSENTVNTPHWTDDSNLKLRRAVREGMNEHETYVKWFSAMLRADFQKKYLAYKKQLRECASSNGDDATPTQQQAVSRSTDDEYLDIDAIVDAHHNSNNIETEELDYEEMQRLCNSQFDFSQEPDTSPQDDSDDDDQVFSTPLQTPIRGKRDTPSQQQSGMVEPQDLREPHPESIEIEAPSQPREPVSNNRRTVASSQMEPSAIERIDLSETLPQQTEPVVIPPFDLRGGTPDSEGMVTVGKLGTEFTRKWVKDAIPTDTKIWEEVRKDVQDQQFIDFAYRYRKLDAQHWIAISINDMAEHTRLAQDMECMRYEFMDKYGVSVDTRRTLDACVSMVHEVETPAEKLLWGPETIGTVCDEIVEDEEEAEQRQRDMDDLNDDLEDNPMYFDRDRAVEEVEDDEGLDDEDLYQAIPRLKAPVDSTQVSTPKRKAQGHNTHVVRSSPPDVVVVPTSPEELRGVDRYSDADLPQKVTRAAQLPDDAIVQSTYPEESGRQLPKPRKRRRAVDDSSDEGIVCSAELLKRRKRTDSQTHPTQKSINQSQQPSNGTLPSTTRQETERRISQLSDADRQRALNMPPPSSVLARPSAEEKAVNRAHRQQKRTKHKDRRSSSGRGSVSERSMSAGVTAPSPAIASTPVVAREATVTPNTSVVSGTNGFPTRPARRQREAEEKSKNEQAMLASFGSDASSDKIGSED